MQQRERREEGAGGSEGGGNGSGAALLVLGVGKDGVELGHGLHVPVCHALRHERLPQHLSARALPVPDMSAEDLVPGLRVQGGDIIQDCRDV